MIKQLVQLVMPKELGLIGFGTAVAGLNVAAGLLGKNKNKRVRRAQEQQVKTQKAIRNENAGRERRRQVKSAVSGQAQIQALNLATGGQGASSGATNASAEVSANLANNLGNLNTGLASQESTTAAAQNVSNANQSTTGEILFQTGVSLLPAIIGKMPELPTGGGEAPTSFFSGENKVLNGFFDTDFFNFGSPDGKTALEGFGNTAT